MYVVLGREVEVTGQPDRKVEGIRIRIFNAVVYVVRRSVQNYVFQFVVMYIPDVKNVPADCYESLKDSTWNMWGEANVVAIFAEIFGDHGKHSAFGRGFRREKHPKLLR